MKKITSLICMAALCVALFASCSDPMDELRADELETTNDTEGVHNSGGGHNPPPPPGG